MQIVINFNEIDLQDWVEDVVDDEITLREIFKEEILKKFISKINYDIEVKRYIQDNIADNLCLKISGFKDDIAIKTIVSEIIESKLRATGSFCFLDRYAEDVKKVVDKYFEQYPKNIEQAMQSSIRLHIEEILKELYNGSKMREFIDIEKLSAHIFDILSTEKGGENNGITE